VLHLAHGTPPGDRTREECIDRAVSTEIREPWWPIVDDTTDAAWRNDLQLLDEYHAQLIDAVERATPEQLARIPKPGDQPIAAQLLGLAVHDGYHAGQIKQLALHFAGASP
jgi:hypothetical protein